MDEHKLRKKRWSCPSCQYDSGRRFNVERHILKIHRYGEPLFTSGYLPVWNTKNKLATRNQAVTGEYLGDRTLSLSQPRPFPLSSKKSTYDEILDTIGEPNTQVKKMKMTNLMTKYVIEVFASYGITLHVEKNS